MRAAGAVRPVPVLDQRPTSSPAWLTWPPIRPPCLRADFTGFWALAKHEGMDEFLRAAGFPWVVRKAALKFGGSAVDLVAHSGPLLKVTSLNAKGSWFREYDVEREVVQRNAEGTMCKTSSWWEGAAGGVLPLRMAALRAHACGCCPHARRDKQSALLVWASTWAGRQTSRSAPHPSPAAPPHPTTPPPSAGRVLRSRMEGSELGVVESWRYLHGASMAVRTALRPARGGPEAVVFWFFDRMETLSRHVARSHGGRSGASLLQLIESGAVCVCVCGGSEVEGRRAGCRGQEAGKEQGGAAAIGVHRP